MSGDRDTSCTPAAKSPTGATAADDVPPNSSAATANAASMSMVSAMTPAQMWQQQQLYLWQQQQFAAAAAAARKMQPAGDAGGSHAGQPILVDRLGRGEHSPYRAAKTVSSRDSGGTGVRTTAQYIRLGEEGNDGTGLRGTSKLTTESDKGPRYVYRDFSHITKDAPGRIVMNAPLTTTTSSTAAASGGDGDGNSSSASTKSIREIRSAKLPVKLEHMLSDSSLSSIVGWMPHGRAWKVFKTKDFIDKVLPRYFESSNYSSFIRIVNAWGFRRFTSAGPDCNAYYHELFLRDRPHLYSRMKRLPKKARKAPISKDDEPNFYALEERISKEGFVKGSTMTSVGPTSTCPSPAIWMNTWMQHNPWMHLQQAPMAMPMFTPAAVNATGAIEGGKSVGGTNASEGS